MLECLEQLKQRNLQLGVVSNSDPRITDVLKALQITPDYIPEDRWASFACLPGLSWLTRHPRPSILTSWEADIAKPDPRIFEKACQRFGMDPAETLMIGDDFEEDVQAAQKAGLRGLLVNRQATEADYVRRTVRSGDLSDIDAVASLNDVPNWIKKQG